VAIVAAHHFARLAEHWVAFGTPRKLPKVADLQGRVAVLDIAFASESGGRKKGFEKTTRKFIDGLGERLVAWIDHHDSVHHRLFADDPRFVLATKAQHGACPEMVTPERVRALGPADTVVCHTDFDGLASAAKWLRGGVEPYPGCDADARAIDTRIGFPGAYGLRFDRAIRARPRDPALLHHIVAQLTSGLARDADWVPIGQAEQALLPLEDESKRLADLYRCNASSSVVFLDLKGREHLPYDKTLLLLHGQQKATIAAVADGDTVTFAAPFNSGIDFLRLFGLSGGMPTLVSLHRAKLGMALRALACEDLAADADLG
jgi:hypothetical protein